MGANKATSGPGGGNNKTYSSSREIGLMNQYKKPKQRAIDTQKDKNEAFREQGAYTTRRRIDKLPAFLPGAAILKGLSPKLEENSRRTRKFFTDKVLTDPRGLKNFGVNKKQFESLSVEKQNQIYNNYITTRRDNKTDGYGTVFRESGNQVVQTPPVATTMPVGTPTEVEISQSEATKAEDPIELRKRKAKARGRSPTIMTGVTGATGGLTLGKPSLLGR